MTATKLAALSITLQPIRTALKQSKLVFNHFVRAAGKPASGRKMNQHEMTFGETSPPAARAESRTELPASCREQAVYDFLLLAYLDSAGYAERSTRTPPFDQFHAILERYYFVAEKIQKIIEGTESELGRTTCLESDSRELPLKAETIDGIIFSPPYSFAIDYLDNDLFHLSYLGVDISELKERMIGLRGRTLGSKYENYKRDMDCTLRECSRVLRSGRLCTVVVGTNNNQLSKILNIAPDQVPGIDDLMVDLGRDHGMSLVRRISRQITGMANTMRSEFIVILQKQ